MTPTVPGTRFFHSLYPLRLNISLPLFGKEGGEEVLINNHRFLLHRYPLGEKRDLSCISKGSIR
jgi:hypothetical protein